MNFLSETCPIFTREEGGWVQSYQHDEVAYDDYVGGHYALGTNQEVKATSERPAGWWCVATYLTSRAYGGPEEGGWWYTCWELVEHAKIGFFENYKDAKDYAKKLQDYCDKENKGGGEERLAVRCFTEEMPGTYFPKTRPYYS